MDTTNTQMRSKIVQNIESLFKSISFEYDDEVKQYCAFFVDIKGYCGQGNTKNEAFAELIASYLDTKDF